MKFVLDEIEVINSFYLLSGVLLCTIFVAVSFLMDPILGSDVRCVLVANSADCVVKIWSADKCLYILK